MSYANAQWIDADQTELGVDWNGVPIRIRAVPGLMHYDAIREAKLDIADPALASLKAELCAKVDDAAEAERLKYITPGSGMVLTYQEKFAQAVAVEQMGEEAANAMTENQRLLDFPILSASVGIEAETLWDCAVLVRERYTLFAQLANGIERTRLHGKAQMRAATTVDGVRAAYEALRWPTP